MFEHASLSTQGELRNMLILYLYYINIPAKAAER